MFWWWLPPVFLSSSLLRQRLIQFGSSIIVAMLELQRQKYSKCPIFLSIASTQNPNLWAQPQVLPSFTLFVFLSSILFVFLTICFLQVHSYLCLCLVSNTFSCYTLMYLIQALLDLGMWADVTSDSPSAHFISSSIGGWETSSCVDGT